MRFGDRNSRFFHCSTIIRRKKNHFLSLQDEQGDWISNQDEVEQLVTTFINLFKVDCVPSPLLWQRNFPPLSHDQMAFLDEELPNDEIIRTLFRIGSFKTPGEDGFHAAFYQKKWNIVGDSLCNLVRAMFYNPRVFIQTDPVLNVGHFKPISLGESFYPPGPSFDPYAISWTPSSDGSFSLI